NKTDASKDTNNADSSNTDDIKNTSNINKDENTTDENNNSSYIVKENQPNDPSLKYYEKVNYDTATKYYCLYSQAFIYEDKAIAAWEKIKEQNIASTVLKEDNSYKIRIGSDYNLKDAKKIREELNEKSIYTYVLAYDKDVEKEIEKLKQLINDNKIKEYKERYVKLRNEIKSKSTYDRYVDQIDFIYRNAQ
ncbi:MAG: SPOR domain-containing protein, partial [Bacilli bacterium]